MKLIAHRGNINGPDPLNENNPEFIDAAIAMGYDVEIDIRLIDHKFYLGHDDPQYHVSMTWLVKKKDNLWIHCKNLESLQSLIGSPVEFNYFWHQTDDFTLTSKKYIWTYPGKKYNYKSVIVMPELNVSLENFSKILKYDCFGICSDYVGRLV